jgi:hypothetical protein
MYNARKTKASHTQEIDNALEYKDWPHPANFPKITVSEDNKDPIIQTYRWKYMDNHFSSPYLFDNLAMKQIYFCQTQQEGHATQHGPEENETPMGRPSGMGKG